MRSSIEQVANGVRARRIAGFLEVWNVRGDGLHSSMGRRLPIPARSHDRESLDRQHGRFVQAFRRNLDGILQALGIGE